VLKKVTKKRGTNCLNGIVKVFYSYCLHLASGDHSFAEDITQMVFITAARRIIKFNLQQAPFRAWLFGIAKKHFIKLKSKELKRKQHNEIISCEPKKTDVDNTSSLLIYETLAELPCHYRIVLEAKYLQGMTVNQIAEIMGTTTKATESLLIRAKVKFAEIYRKIRIDLEGSNGSLL